MMTLKNRAIETANEAKNSASNLSNELQQSKVFEQAKSAFAEGKEKVSKVETGSLKVMNFFAVFSLFALLMSTFFPVTSMMGSSVPLSEITPTWLYLLTLCALVSYLFGAKQLLSRGLIMVLLSAIFFTLYQQVSELLSAANMFGRVRTDDFINIALQMLDVGFYLFIISVILVFIALLKPGYKSNDALWRKLIEK